jgi:hypothetical protein
MIQRCNPVHRQQSRRLCGDGVDGAAAVVVSTTVQPLVTLHARVCVKRWMYMS